jgi:hypothetical protein
MLCGTFAQELLLLSLITDREHFPHMTLWLAPVHNISTIGMIDLEVVWTMREAPERYACGLDALEYSVEFMWRDPEAVVLDGEGTFRLIEIEGQAVIHIDGGKWANARFRPGHAKELGQKFGRRDAISSRYEKVI